MSEIKTREARHDASSEVVGGAPLLFARRGLTVLGITLVAINVVLRMRGGGDSPIPIVFWGAAALSFFASFIIFMMDPQGVAARAVPVGGGATRNDALSGRANGRGALRSTGPGEPSSPPMLRPGNPLRLARGGVTAASASFLAFLLMAHEGQSRWGVALGTVLMAVASWGVMDLMGTFDDPDDRVAATVSFARLARPLATFFGSALAFCLALGLASAGVALPGAAWGVVVTLAFVGTVTALFETGRTLGVWAIDEHGADRPFWKRHGFWVVTIAAALYFPFMGTSSLWDPWETHYGEVAREMLARDDWISLWWAQDGWFWSKPVLDMWMQAIAMATLGVHYQPDKMLIGDGTLPTMHPEWAVRAPVVLFTIVALYLLYKGVAKSFGRRAAFLGSVVLATMPDWYLLAHQTMTDMPCVAPMTACMGLVLLGLGTPEAADARVYEVKLGSARIRLSAWHLVFGGILICVLPQILYLVSRNIDFVWHAGARGFRPHWDEFRSGSGMGNCGLPGNEDCRSTMPATIPHSTGANPTGIGAIGWRLVGAFEPIVQGALWAAVLGLVLYLSWGERRMRRLLYLAAWFFAALATLGKGPEGVGLPVLVTLAYLGASRPGEEMLARMTRAVREISQFEIVAGLLVILAVAMPWYVAMYVRHGSPFTDRLIFHDMFNRAFHHVHDTNEGDDTSFRFYAWQLGYALFPWTGLAPLGLMWWLRRPSTDRDRERADASVLLCLWFILAFALFSFMGTKFHHYIFPAVPPVAMLIGAVLDDMIGDKELPTGIALAKYVAGLLTGVTLLVVGVTRFLPGSFLGTKPDGHLPAASLAVGLTVSLVGVAVLAGFAFRIARAPRRDGEPIDRESEHASHMLAAGAVAAALVLIVVGRDLVIKPENGDQPGAIHLLHLYTYNYRRGWPDSLDFSAALAAFSAISIVACAALAIRKFRAHAVAALCALAFVWGIWGLDVYMQRTAQHWGQHEIIAAYYADRHSADEQLIAYQMNWKGENFYTGNHVPAFVSTGATFTSWLKKQREAGQKVMYFITEHGRISGLKNEVAAKSYREVTDKVLNNKFILVRAEL